MSAPHALIEFFQKEAMEYLGRLDQMLADAQEQTARRAGSCGDDVSAVAGRTR